VFTPSGALPDAVTRFARDVARKVKLVRISPSAASRDTEALIDADRSLARVYDAEEGAVILVRPDGHVAGRWRRPDPATLQQALTRARGLADQREVVL
jgi:hypothetical protein